MKLRAFAIIMLVSGFVSVSGPVRAAVDMTEGFEEVKSEHFRVRFLSGSDRDLARKALERAEYFYDRIARDIGFSRYDGYWTWERRAGIVLFPDQVSFTRFTGQPEWSRGYASRESPFFSDRTIVSFTGQPNFFDEVLPHELAHLMLWDYFTRHISNVPVWFEEGVAQLQETDKRQLAREALRSVVQAGNQIPLRTLKTLRPVELKDNTKVALFYAESLSIVVFLIEKYGQEAFYRLSKELREGQTFEEALARAYKGAIVSMDTLEERWVRYILDQ